MAVKKAKSGAKRKVKRKPAAPQADTSELAEQLDRIGMSSLARSVRCIEESGAIQPKDVVQLLRAHDLARQIEVQRDGAPAVNTKTLAGWLGVTTVTLGSWSRNGFPKSVDGLFDVSEVMRWAREEHGECNRLKRKYERLAAETKELTDLKAQKLAIEVAEKRGELVSAESSELDRITKFNRVRRAFERLPRAMGPLVAGQDEGKAAEILATEVSRILGSLATEGGDDGD